MKVLDMTHGRETYTTEIRASLLWEAALGIAAATYSKIHHTLEYPAAGWEEIRTASPDLAEQLQYVQENNTWNALLQLLHQRPFDGLPSLLNYIADLDDRELRFQTLPYLGREQQTNRQQAAEGDERATEALIASCSEHLFFPNYIRFITEVEPSDLRSHLITVMQLWYERVIIPEEDRLLKMLYHDAEEKKKMQQRLEPEAFVEWATGGIAYPPEPSVSRVILIPHYIYRPWNIRAKLEGTKIFYYPIADESIDERRERDLPGSMLVRRLKALGDENRLRMVKMILQEELSLHELTKRLQLSKSTVHHHLMLLQAAQLIESKGKGYRLKRKSFIFLEKELERYLEEGADIDA